MLNLCNDFTIFGSGDGQLILIAQENKEQYGYILTNPLIKEVSMHRDLIDVSSMENSYRQYIAGIGHYELTLVGCQIDCITGKDLKTMYDPVMQKSIFELMKVVNKKLELRL